MVKSLCRGKKTHNPNKCKKIRGCKVASGTKRTYCRKAKNHTKNKKTKKTKTRRLGEVARLKGYNIKVVRELKRLGH